MVGIRHQIHADASPPRKDWPIRTRCWKEQARQPEARDLLEWRIKEIAPALAASFGASAEVQYVRRYPVMNNSPAQTEFCKQVVRDWLGEGGLVANAGPVTASEVFALFPGEGTGLLHQYRQWRG